MYVEARVTTVLCMRERAPHAASTEKSEIEIPQIYWRLKRSFLDDEAAIPKQRNILFLFFGGGIRGGRAGELLGKV